MVHLDVAASCCCPATAPAAGAPATDEGPASPGVGGAYENCEVSRPYLRIAKDNALRTCCPAQSNGSLPFRKAAQVVSRVHRGSLDLVCFCMHLHAGDALVAHALTPGVVLRQRGRCRRPCLHVPAEAQAAVGWAARKQAHSFDRGQLYDIPLGLSWTIRRRHSRTEQERLTTPRSKAKTASSFSSPHPGGAAALLGGRRGRRRPHTWAVCKPASDRKHQSE